MLLGSPQNHSHRTLLSSWLVKQFLEKGSCGMNVGLYNLRRSCEKRTAFESFKYNSNLLVSQSFTKYNFLTNATPANRS